MNRLASGLSRTTRETIRRWLVEKVPRDHQETDEAFRRRRRVVGGVTVVGAGLLGYSLSTRPGATRFYLTTLSVAATWTVGGLASGPLHLGYMRDRHLDMRRPLATPVALGAGAFGVFYALAVVAKKIPILDEAITSVLSYAFQGEHRWVLTTVLANGVAEEVFFRGALYAAVGRDLPVVKSTAAYAVATMTTRNPALVLASGVMGLLFALQRRTTGGIEAPIITHLTWSTLMLRYLPPLYADELHLHPARTRQPAN